MIPFTFAYYKPDTVSEAVEFFQFLQKQGKNPVYYSGGTEIITLARLNQIRPDAVIDIKGISECNVLESEHNQLIIGAGVSLTRLTETNVFPLLTKSAGRVADHTSRGKITLGGNICGNFIYREAVLPLLASDSSVKIAGPAGIRTIPIMKAFQERLQLAAGEFLVQVAVSTSYLNLPCEGVKKTRMDRIGYPLISLAAIKVNHRIQFAISGICAFPFRSLKLEDEFNSNLSQAEKINKVLSYLPAPIVMDVEGTANYRAFVLKNTLKEMLVHLEAE